MAWVSLSLLTTAQQREQGPTLNISDVQYYPKLKYQVYEFNKTDSELSI